LGLSPLVQQQLGLNTNQLDLTDPTQVALAQSRGVALPPLPEFASPSGAGTDTSAIGNLDELPDFVKRNLGVPGFAKGGATDDMAIVGESGPELAMALPGGGFRVVPLDPNRLPKGIKKAQFGGVFGAQSPQLPETDRFGQPQLQPQFPDTTGVSRTNVSLQPAGGFTQGGGGLFGASDGGLTPLPGISDPRLTPDTGGFGIEPSLGELVADPRQVLLERAAAAGIDTGFNVSGGGLPVPPDVTQGQLQGFARETAFPNVRRVFQQGLAPRGDRFSFALPTFRGLSGLSADDRANAETALRLGAFGGQPTTFTDVERAVRERFLPSQGRGRARLAGF
ncbi:hypothetical protein LCGC14_2728260, partial [marine sediment metagenome]